MGDHRATVVIDFTIHGKTYHQEWWINWFPDPDIDYRIVEWFRECWDDAKVRYDKEVAKYWHREHATEIEQQERAELARLREKYGQG